MSRLYEAIKHFKTLAKFVSPAQIETLVRGIRSEEKDFFFDKVEELANTIETMHKTYEQDGKGDNAIVHLHYFVGGCDWYITERDMEDEQLQAFGKANLGHGGELGYISIVELMSNNIEIDLHWEAKPLKDCK